MEGGEGGLGAMSTWACARVKWPKTKTASGFQTGQDVCVLHMQQVTAASTSLCKMAPMSLGSLP